MFETSPVTHKSELQESEIVSQMHSNEDCKPHLAVSNSTLNSLPPSVILQEYVLSFRLIRASLPFPNAPFMSILFSHRLATPERPSTESLARNKSNKAP